MHEAKTQLSRLVARVEHGEEIIIARSGKPVAKLVALREELKPRPWGTMKGMFEVPDDFDDPLPPEIQKYFDDPDIDLDRDPDPSRTIMAIPSIGFSLRKPSRRTAGS